MRGLELLVRESGARLFLRPGAGKTSIVLKAFDVLRRQGMVDTLLVLAPLRVIMTSWPSELGKWEDFEGMTYSVVHGGPRGRREAMEASAEVYLMNVEGLLTGEWKPVDMGARRRVFTPNPYAAQWLADRKVMLVVDESTKFKDSSSQRFKTLRSYLPLFKRAVILTGTPRPGTLEDLFAQCYLTDSGRDLGQFITNFRARYMMPHPSGFGWTEQVGAAERVAEIIAPTTLQIREEEAVPVMENHIWLPMPPALRAQYNELSREFLLALGDATIMAPNSGVLYGKLRQFAQGAIFGPDGETYHEVHQLKLDALENILIELNGEPAFCLYQYRHDYERVGQRLGREVPRIGGGVGAGQGRSVAASFSAGALPLLLGHPQSVALGIDGLQDNCNNVIWLGNTSSYEQDYQANLRIARPGQRAASVVIHRIMLDCGVERAALAKVVTRSMSESEFLSTLRANIEEELQ